MYRLPRTATAPFCPSEVKGSVAVDPGLLLWKKLLRFAGPGLLVSVGIGVPPQPVRRTAATASSAAARERLARVIAPP